MHERITLQLIATLPEHATIDFRAIPVQGRTIWYACWHIGNRPFTRCLGEDVHGLIAREQARRGASAERIEEAQPKHTASPRAPVARGTYRAVQHSACEHEEPRLSCPTCLDWLKWQHTVNVAAKRG